MKKRHPMMPVQQPKPGKSLLAWHLVRQQWVETWDSGIGAEKKGGRWNSKGQRAIYCSLDPSTAILEVAVHTGFALLDTLPHFMMCIEIIAEPLHIVMPEDVPNPLWLTPGTPSAGQQAMGNQWLSRYGIVLCPSAVSHQCWNAVLEPQVAKGRYRLHSKERFALDTRLHQAQS